MDPLLDVQRRDVDLQVRRVLFVLAPPHELRVEVAVAPLVGHADGALLLISHQRLVLGGWQVRTPGLLVLEGLDGLGLGASCLS